MSRIDLNCDLGEGFGVYTIGRDEEVITYISSANVGCDFHTGDPCVMDHTVRLTKEKSVSIGVYPGFPDLVGFGHRNMSITPAEVKTYMRYQIGALNAFYVSNEAPLAHVKPHGTLYSTAAKDMKLAMTLAETVYEVDPKLIFLGLSGSKMLEAAQQVGLTCTSEVLAGRTYDADGNLVAKGTPGTVIHGVDECVRRIIGMTKGNVVTAVAGKQILLKPQSICVHGDGAEVVEFVKHIREGLAKERVEITDLRVCTE